LHGIFIEFHSESVSRNAKMTRKKGEGNLENMLRRAGCSLRGDGAGGISLKVLSSEMDQAER
jgi:hypothetical protein